MDQKDYYHMQLETFWYQVCINLHYICLKPSSYNLKHSKYSLRWKNDTGVSNMCYYQTNINFFYRAFLVENAYCGEQESENNVLTA